MKLPKQNELIQVFSYDYTDGKLRYFKEKSSDPKFPICVYANGQTKETTKGDVEYWKTWCYPSELPNYKPSSMYDSLEDAKMEKISSKFNKTP